MADVVVEVLVPGALGSRIRRTYTEVDTPTFAASADGTMDHYLLLSAQTTVTLPAPGNGATYHIKNNFNAISTVACVTANGIEDATSVSIYYGESFDLYSVGGVWRLF